MSVVLNLLQPNAPQFVDGVENVFLRANINITASNTTLNPAVSYFINPGIFFDTNGNVVIRRVKIELAGQFTGALSTKRLFLGWGSQTLYDSGLVAQNNVHFYMSMSFMNISLTQIRKAGTVFFNAPGVVGPGAATLVHQYLEIATLAGLLSASRDLTPFTQVSNAGDSISLDDIIVTVA